MDQRRPFSAPRASPRVAPTVTVHDAPPTPPAAKWLAIGLFGIGAFVVLSGVAFLSFTWPLVWGPHLFFLVAGAAALGSGFGLLRGHAWGWAIGWSIVAAGAVYAVYGLAAGYGSGIIGLALWGGVAYLLLREDVRGHCDVGW